MVAFQHATNPSNVCYQDATTLQPVVVTQSAPLPVSIGVPIGSNSETVAASQTAQVLGGTGAAGDYLDHLTVTPATTSPGAVSIIDGAGSPVIVFAGGASSVPSLIPFTIQLGAVSTSGAWKVTTGANISLIAYGKFT